MNNERNHLLTDTDSGICAQQPDMGMPARHTNEEIRESGAMPYMVKAMEHDISDAPAVDPVAAYKAVENGVVGAYKAVEDGVVGAYKAVEKGAVDAYRKVEDAMVDKLFRKDGETIAQAKDRLRKK